MNLKLQGKTAFITRSTSGIGWATARALAQEGVHVILNGRGAVGRQRPWRNPKNFLMKLKSKGLLRIFYILIKLKPYSGNFPRLTYSSIMWVFIHQPNLLKRVMRIGIVRLK